MCGIIGIFSRETINIDLSDAFRKQADRGQDSYGTSINEKTEYFSSIKKFEERLRDISGKNILVHNLHSIVGSMQQPIAGRFIANCEIYNWKELNEEHKLNAKNDAELLFMLLEKFGVEKTLDIIDGDYSFAYINQDKIYLARDLIGVKPIIYGIKNNALYFASEKKALDELNIESQPLNPDNILIFDGKKITLKKRKFYKTGKELKIKEEKIEEELEKYLIDAIKKRIKDVKKVGILFSGGIDSTFIAFVCKKLKKDIICYTAAFVDETIREPQDLIWAKKAAKKYGFKLRISILNYENMKMHLKNVMDKIETTDVIKVGVACPFDAACKLAKKDGIKVMLSGLGSEELFAGYQRHLDALTQKKDVNKECLEGLKQIWERDLYRDDLITMSNNIELRLPFLDNELIKYSLRIPSKYKINDKQKKIILRKIALNLGLDE